MYSKNYLDVIFDEPYAVSGEKAKGKLIIYFPKEDVKKILVHILPAEFWSVKNGSSTDKGLYASPFMQKYIDLNLDNIEYMYDENKNIKKNICVKPFSITIPEDYLPCFEYQYKNSKHAHIRYEFKIKMKIKNREISKNKYLPILSKPTFNKNMDLYKEVKQNLKQFFLFNKGEIGFKVFLYNIIFKYNSICELLIDIDNTKGKLATEEYKVVLRRKINLYEYIYHKEYNEEKEILVIKEKAKVSIGEKKNFSCKFNIEDKDNNKYNQEDVNIYYKNCNINFFLPTVNGYTIQCEYELKISLYFEKFVDYSHRPRVIFPISIIHESLEEYLKRKGINPAELNITKEKESITPGNITEGNSINDNNSIKDNSNSIEENKINEYPLKNDINSENKDITQKEISDQTLNENLSEAPICLDSNKDNINNQFTQK